MFWLWVFFRRSLKLQKNLTHCSVVCSVTYRTIWFFLFQEVPCFMFYHCWITSLWNFVWSETQKLEMVIKYQERLDGLPTADRNPVHRIIFDRTPFHGTTPRRIPHAAISCRIPLSQKTGHRVAVLLESSFIKFLRTPSLLIFLHCVEKHVEFCQDQRRSKNQHVHVNQRNVARKMFITLCLERDKSHWVDGGKSVVFWRGIWKNASYIARVSLVWQQGTHHVDDTQSVQQSNCHPSLQMQASRVSKFTLPW